MHWQWVPTPEKHTYEQMLGDLPTAKLEELLQSKYRMEYFQDCKVFTYDKATDEVQYQRTHDHIDPKRFLPSNA